MAKAVDYNAVVIGGGSAGLVCAYIGSLLKARVALIEKNKMGGDCLNTGCVPSKSFIRSATVLSYIRRHHEFGIRKAVADFNFSEIMQRVQRVIQKVEPHDSINRYTALGVDCHQGEAKILSPHEVKVNGRVLKTKSVIIAAGASPGAPRVAGIEKISYYHTDNIWELRRQPKRLVVLGGGPVGCELAQCFARFGTKVILVQTAPQILHREDPEIAEIVARAFEREGVEIHLNAKPQEIYLRSGKKYLRLEGGGEIEFDEVLAAVGRKPRVTGYGLEELGIELDERGALRIDAYGRTNVRNIFACGDVIGRYQFTHMAAHAAGYCMVNALFQPLKRFKIDWRIVPWCTYTDPEIGRAGLNEKEAREARIRFERTVFPLAELDRAITDEEAQGLVKVLTAPGRDKILGVTICGYHAGDILSEFVLAMKYGLGLKKILNTIHVYPTLAEANRHVAGEWRRNHSSPWLLKLLSRFNDFRRMR